MFTKICRISSESVGKHFDVCLELWKLNSCTKLNQTIQRRMLSNLTSEAGSRSDINGDATNPSTYLKNVYTGLDSRYLKVAWSDGTATRFPYNFLRDNCKCPQCFESSSKQKLFNTARDLKLNIEVEEAIVSEDGQHLKCVWPDEHESLYSFDWLHNMRMPEENESRQHNSDSLVKDELIVWNRKMMQDKIPFYDYNAVMNEDKTLFDFLYCFYQHGIILLNDAPTRDGVLLELAGRIGYSWRTHYGETFQVKDLDNPSNLAYTSQKLHLHIDMPFQTSPPHIQLLHCIHHNTTGGNSIFVDGFNVAKQLHKNHPDAFNVLKSFYVQYADRGTDAYGEFLVGCSHPVINLNKHGRLYQILYNPSVESESKGDCTLDELLAFYDASYRLADELDNPENVVDIHLTSGQIAMFGNNRVLHGRSAFEATGGTMGRWLQGIYFEWDVIFSKLRVLQRKLGLKTPYLSEQSDDFF